MAKKEEPADNVLTSAAKKIGKAAGKVASAIGVASDTPPADEGPQEPKVNTPSQKIPKLAKKGKSRLPRREKKARQKAGTL